MSSDRSAIRRTRTCKSMAALLLLIGLAGISGCTAMLMGDGAAAGRPIGSASSDSRDDASDRRIMATVRSRFAADPELAARALRVDSVQGVVTLRGDVGNYADRDRAVRLAGDVSGVSRVVNQIGIAR